MSFEVPSSIKESFEHPPVGVLLCRVAEVGGVMLGKEAQRYAIAVGLEIVEPNDYAGAQFTVNFFLGTDEDPGSIENGVRPETFSKRGTRFHKLTQATGVDIRGMKSDIMFSELKGRLLKARTTADREPAVFGFGARKGQRNEYAGRWRAEWSQWMSANEGPSPEVRTTIAELMAKDEATATVAAGNGGATTAGFAPNSTLGTAPPPPPSPGSAPMPRVSGR